MIKKYLRVFFILSFVISLLTATPKLAVADDALTIAAASSFSFALTELAEGFSASTHIPVKLIFGSSGLLARQIERGAPFDVFISANNDFMEDLARRGAVEPASKRSFAEGAIVIALPTAAGVSVREIRDLSRANVKRVAIANPRHAPYGRAAEEALKNSGLWKEIRKKIVYGENVRQTLQFVESGNVDAAIVALSLSRRGGIRVVPVKKSLYGPIRQSVAIVSSSTHGEAAGRFVAYLTGEAAGVVLEKYGFSRP